MARKLGVWRLALLAVLLLVGLALLGLAAGSNTAQQPPVERLGAAHASPFPATFVDSTTWLEILRVSEGDGLGGAAPVTSGVNPPWSQQAGRALDLSRDVAVGSGQVDLPAGGVVPHHLLAGTMIVEFFQEMRRAQPERVLVLGPNHWGKGAPVITADRSWETPAGLVPVDADALKFLASVGVEVANEILREEHAIGNLMPFMAHYLPGATVVPVVLRGGLPLSRLRQLAASLEPLLEEGTVVVASVDFSHYLSPTEAELKDQETLAAMQRRDLAALLAMGNDHLDSPPALAALFLLMEQQGHKEFVVTGHANSGDFLRSTSLASTSYFTILF